MVSLDSTRFRTINPKGSPYERLPPQPHHLVALGRPQGVGWVCCLYLTSQQHFWPGPSSGWFTGDKLRGTGGKSLWWRPFQLIGEIKKIYPDCQLVLASYFFKFGSKDVPNPGGICNPPPGFLGLPQGSPPSSVLFKHSLTLSSSGYTPRGPSSFGCLDFSPSLKLIPLSHLLHFICFSLSFYPRSWTIPKDTRTSLLGATTHSWPVASNSPLSCRFPWPQAWRCWLSSQPLHTWLQTIRVGLRSSHHIIHKKLRSWIKRIYTPQPPAVPRDWPMKTINDKAQPRWSPMPTQNRWT